MTISYVAKFSQSINYITILLQVDDPQNGASNVHQHDVTVPPGDHQTSDGRNQSKTNPTVCEYFITYCIL